MNTGPVVPVPPLPRAARAPASPKTAGRTAGFGQMVDKARQPSQPEPVAETPPAPHAPVAFTGRSGVPASPLFKAHNPRGATAPAPGHSPAPIAPGPLALDVRTSARVVPLPGHGAQRVAAPVTHVPRRWGGGRITTSTRQWRPQAVPGHAAAPSGVSPVAAGVVTASSDSVTAKTGRASTPADPVLRPLPREDTPGPSRSRTPAPVPAGKTGSAGVPAASMPTASSESVPVGETSPVVRVPSAVGGAGPTVSDSVPVSPTSPAPPAWAIRAVGSAHGTQRFQLVPPSSEASLHVTLDSLTHAIHLGLPQEWEPVAADRRADPESLLAAVSPSGFAPQQVRVTVQAGGSSPGNRPPDGHRGQQPSGTPSGGARRRRRS